MKLVIGTVIVLFISACSGMIKYTKPDGTLAGEREVLECRYEAQKATASQGKFRGLMDSSMHNEQVIMSTCMRLKGYEPTL